LFDVKIRKMVDKELYKKKFDEAKGIYYLSKNVKTKKKQSVSKIINDPQKLKV
jgi:hypothetical protein